MVYANFNSIKVRLEQGWFMDNASRMGDFNSIKVRLELSFHFLREDGLGFQFHKGAIRTLLRQSFQIAQPISIP